MNIRRVFGFGAFALGSTTVLALLLGLSLQTAARDSSTTRLRFEPHPSSGVVFQHRAFRSESRRAPEIMGGGVVLADFNADGALDIVLIDGGPLSGNEISQKSNPDSERRRIGGTRLFLNQLGKKADSAFRDVTEEWQLESAGYGMGGAAGDYDNDGHTDLFLTSAEGPDLLLRNTGSGFEDVTERAGIVQDGLWSTSAGFFDADNDGDLDLFVVRYLRYQPGETPPCFYNRQPVYCTPLLEQAQPDRLLINNGDGTFDDQSDRLSSLPGKGLALALGDVDQDGDIDPYVANDTTANQLWVNTSKDGLVRFEERGLISGVGLSESGKELAGMGADVTDVDGDGLVDIGSTNFQLETTTIYLQLGQGVFREASDAVGVGQTARSRLSFGMDFFDADNDGDEDLLVANGHLYDNLSGFSNSVSFAQPNTLYELRGVGGQARFFDVTEGAGSALEEVGVSRGLATGDLDGDGGLDFVVTNNDGPVQVALNQTRGRGNFVSLWLQGRKANRSAIGASVEARIGSRTIRRQVVGSASYLSASDLRVHLGLGEASQVDQLTVRWPGSEAQVLRNVKAGHYLLGEGLAPVPYVPGEYRHSDR